MDHSKEDVSYTNANKATCWQAANIDVTKVEVNCMVCAKPVQDSLKLITLSIDKDACIEVWQCTDAFPWDGHCGVVRWNSYLASPYNAVKVLVCTALDWTVSRFQAERRCQLCSSRLLQSLCLTKLFHLHICSTKQGQKYSLPLVTINRCIKSSPMCAKEWSLTY